MADNNNEICSQEEFEEKIRPDLKDISNTINHLLQLSDHFRQKASEWGRWWNNDVADYIHIKGDGDKELIWAAEWSYIKGVDTAQTLGDILPKINSMYCSKLKDYVSQIREMQKNWIANDRKRIAECKKIIRARKPLDYSDVETMLNWHKEHLKILRDLDNDLAMIEGSERYKIEEAETASGGEADLPNEKSAERGQNATPAKIINIENFKGILGDVQQTENLQIGDNTRIQKYSMIKKVGIIGTIAALLTILHLLGWLEPIKAFINKILLYK